MARNKKEDLVTVKAKVNLKYDKDSRKINDTFKVRIEDAKEMSERGYVEIIEELSKEDNKEDNSSVDKETGENDNKEGE